MAVGGVVELLSNKRIIGWAIDTDSPNPAIVEMRFDDVPVKKIRCQRTRLGFSSLAPRGLVGFKYKIHPSLLNYVRSKESVTFSLNGSVLPIKVNNLKLAPLSRQRPTQELSALLGNGHVITKQGELRLSIQLDRDWQNRHLEFYNTARTKFKSLFGYDLQLAYGGLLGYVRENNLIYGDDDIDVTYLSRYRDAIDVKSEFIRIFSVLRGSGEEVRIAPIRRNFLKWISPDGAKIDVFPSWMDEKHYFVSPAVGSACVDAVKEGLEVRQFLGHDVLVPKRSETILEATYGPGWRTPDPHFQWVIPHHVRREMRRLTLTREESARLNRSRFDAGGDCIDS